MASQIAVNPFLVIGFIGLALVVVVDDTTAATRNHVGTSSSRSSIAISVAS